MKKNRFYIIIALVSIVVLSLSSCHKKQAAPTGPQPTDFEKAMDAADTVAVKQLIDQFFTYVKGKDFSEAAAMLYRNDVQANREPEQLDNEEMAKVIATLKAVPMVDYKIEYIKFNEDYANEVLCNVVIRKGANGQPDMTTKMFFKPILCMNNWLLCLVNTEYGDKGVVNPDKRDSVEKKFKEETAAAQKAAAVKKKSNADKK